MQIELNIFCTYFILSWHHMVEFLPTHNAKTLANATQVFNKAEENGQISGHTEPSIHLQMNWPAKAFNDIKASSIVMNKSTSS